MNFYWVKTHRFIKQLFPGFVWSMPEGSKTVYLTFDDGPTPEVTEWVLSVLADHDIKATFFCIGKNIESHPDIFSKVIDAGHKIGNHTFNHWNGWKTANNEYLKNVNACRSSIEKMNAETNIFRPPYGKIKGSQSKELRKQGYKIVMWDVLSADFDRTISPEKCLKNVVDNVNDGSIIIFHDSVKAEPNLKHALPQAIAHLKKEGYKFGLIG